MVCHKPYWIARKYAVRHRSALYYTHTHDGLWQAGISQGKVTYIQVAYARTNYAIQHHKNKETKKIGVIQSNSQPNR
jgi:hypothetical protein